MPRCEWLTRRGHDLRAAPLRPFIETRCAPAGSNFRREMRWLRGSVPAARARGGRTRGKRDIRPSVSACREPRTRHGRVLAETPRFSAPCVTVCRGPGSPHTSSDDSSPHPVPQIPRGPARMPANRQDAQPALANVDHGLLGGPVPRLLPQVSRSEGRDLLMPPARNLRGLRPRVLFISSISQLWNAGEM